MPNLWINATLVSLAAVLISYLYMWRDEGHKLFLVALVTFFAAFAADLLGDFIVAS